MGSVGRWWAKYEQRVAAWASFLGLIGLPVASTIADVAHTPREAVYAVCWVLLCVGGFLCFVVYCIRYHRKAKYAEVLPHLRQAIRAIVAEVSRSGRTLDDRKAALARAMDEVSNAFSILTGSSCRCCVKVVRPVKPPEAIMVATFCRNSTEKEAGCEHPLAHNTDFNGLYQDPTKEWFFGNNLPGMAQRGEYANTNQNWQHKYRSTVVWPIRKLSENPQGQPPLLGFLCVDSKRTNPFSEEFDYPIGAMVVEVLSLFLFETLNARQSASRKTLTPSTDGVASGKLTVPANRLVDDAEQQGAASEHDD